jgi:hypothetical protein
VIYSLFSGSSGQTFLSTLRISAIDIAIRRHQNLPTKVVHLQFTIEIDYTGKSCLRELNFIMSKGLLLRRLKKDILGQLPVKKRKKIVLKVDQNILKGINEIIHDNKIESLEKLVDLN